MYILLLSDMVHTIHNWKAYDGVDLYAQSWSTTRRPEAVICLVHGLGEHASRYAHLAEAMCESNISVVAYDLRGHGKSGGKRGHAPNYEALMDDVSLALKNTAELFPDIPLFLMGHSFGGNQVLNFVMRRHPKLQGVIASSPWLKTAFAPPAIKLLLARTVGRLLSSLSQSSELEVNAISRDPEVVKAYTQDPLVHDKITPGLFLGSYEAGLWALQNAANFSLPLLIYHGTDDRLTSYDASKAFAFAVKGDVTWKSFPGFYHEAHNEPEKEQVFSTLVGWVRAHL